MIDKLDPEWLMLRMIRRWGSFGCSVRRMSVWCLNSELKLAGGDDGR